jgi:hypothetical protein
MAVSMERGPSGRALSPRLVNAALGIWLILSAFTWPHAHAQMHNTWICGALCVVFAISGILVPWARYLNTVLAVWLFVSSWALPSATNATLWNNVLCAIAIFVVSLVPSTTKNLPSSVLPPRAA